LFIVLLCLFAKTLITKQLPHTGYGHSSTGNHLIFLQKTCNIFGNCSS